LLLLLLLRRPKSRQPRCIALLLLLLLRRPKSRQPRCIALLLLLLLLLLLRRRRRRQIALFSPAYSCECLDCVTSCCSK
jgi:hypothetical protein